MKKILIGVFAICGLSIYANIDTVASMETEYQELQKKEAEKVAEFKGEKVSLEKELQELKLQSEGKEKTLEKLKRDSEIRWHRDEYKKLAKEYEHYYRKLDKKISDDEAKLNELNRLLSILE
ncbi:hypothetical protein IX317_000826 [Fusobacterium sp. DD29]|uniref:adhesion protein FadA n=1 Tax=unclassified Fusobacterium TaxID=2648384 RepID=UPI001B8D838C|nr:hypothetical protein [Fusobacterium sp. DD45]MBR8710688.1 hypothetical protein [Fusobacterium sp. DD28]MBR8749163.1 hypothetical protein [Fusobacterium sp. DD29]MBR8751264.1 hypothetical protein [Fusobacterium sp. DD26]MBR8761429.1 hypothetical protein [Fusobacterium sp. DD25]MBR8767442.1 hypothetical protein [Fusobacterium sp. DD43]MBR8771497.1 hypothetical protein [Fusobacterium sp. DD40]MBR8775723.1 hypothetical protein [Fusobacterium sp. DD17]MBR8797985.1 hypothetical protein [Fusoba